MTKKTAEFSPKSSENEPLELGCIIMASGLGKRFGGNKLMADFGGKPLLCRVLDTTEGLFARRIVVTRHRDVADLCRRRSIPVVLHDLPLRSDTVRLGLEALGEDMAGCLFCPGDQPLLSRETIETLIACAGREPEYIWRPSWQGVGGTPVLFPRWAFEELRALPGGKGGSAVIKAHPEGVRCLPVREEYELRDVDCPENLMELLQIAQKNI